MGGLLTSIGSRKKSAAALAVAPQSSSISCLFEWCQMAAPAAYRHGPERIALTPPSTHPHNRGHPAHSWARIRDGANADGPPTAIRRPTTVISPQAVVSARDCDVPAIMATETARMRPPWMSPPAAPRPRAGSLRSGVRRTPTPRIRGKRDEHRGAGAQPRL
jgi:hypothetical protein